MVARHSCKMLHFVTLWGSAIDLVCVSSFVISNSNMVIQARNVVDLSSIRPWSEAVFACGAAFRLTLVQRDWLLLVVRCIARVVIGWAIPRSEPIPQRPLLLQYSLRPSTATNIPLDSFIKTLPLTLTNRPFPVSTFLLLRKGPAIFWFWDLSQHFGRMRKHLCVQCPQWLPSVWRSTRQG